MDDSQQHIFKHLSQHEEKPPEGLYNKILAEIHMGAAKDLDNGLEPLKDFSIVPPAALYGQIRKKTLLKEKGIVVYLRKYRAAAAIFILALITAGAIYQLRSKDPAANEIVLKKEIPATILPDTSISITGNNNPIVKITNHKKFHTNNKSPLTRNKNTDTQEMVFIDNDLLTSLTECTDCNFASFFSDKKKLVLKIGPYSSVTVTKKMGDFMKTLYSTNRRNKPTVKAKKARKTLEKWKKTDADYFDSSKEKLALDPLDLTEYIIDNK